MLHMLTFFRLLTAFAITLLGLVACTDSKSIEFKTIYVGKNATWKSPEKTGERHNSPIGFFENAASVEASWLKTSMSSDDLRQVLSKVDFSHQVLIVDAFFQDPPTPGKPVIEFVADFSFDAINIQRSSYDGKNGITTWSKAFFVSTDCTLRKPLTNPFIIAIIERPKKGRLEDAGYVHNSTTGECKAVNKP
jgi:hypothetical protein